MNFDQREIATVLAALRFYQANFDDVNEMREEMSLHFQEVEPLDHEEIDDLCERINCGPTNSLMKIAVAQA